MTRVLKDNDYIRLVLLIYKHSNYEYDKAILLYTYVAIKITSNRINTIYIDKLLLDLNLVDKNVNIQSINKGNNLESKLKEKFTEYQLIEIKSLVFDLLHNGYYA